MAYLVLWLTGVITRNWYVCGVATPILVAGLCIGKLANRWRERAEDLVEMKIGRELSKMSHSLKGPHGG